MFLASKRLTMPGLKSSLLPGAGAFPSYSEKLRLTAPGASRSVWRLPQCFHPSVREPWLTYHSRERWKRRGDFTQLRTAARWQDAVLHAEKSPEVLTWVRSLIVENA